MSLEGTCIGNVRIDRRLGEGGMGEVYLGFDEKLERQVAVKVLAADRRLKPEAKARFLREARLLSRLDDSGICRIHDLVEGDGTDYLILEYIDGVSLSAAVGRAGGEDEKLGLFLGVARALATAHREGIVHRDLKPDNVMVTPQGQVKVLDFGIARSVKAQVVAADESSRRGDTIRDDLAAQASAASEPGLARTRTMAPDEDESGSPGPADPAVRTLHTRVGSLVGTIRYMSPEQASGEPVTAASDLYSLGVMMQELLTDRPAYGESSGMDLLLKVYRAETVPVRGLDPDVASLVRDLTQIDPASRPDAQATADQLQHIIDRPQRERRRRVRAASVAVVCGALVVAAAVTLQARIQAGRRAELAQSFARQAEEISWRMRAEHLSPPHDIRPAIAEVRQRMVEVEAQMEELGALARGPGHAALGRGHLTLGDLGEARRHLAAAVDAGFRSPETDFASGLALGREYRQGLDRALRIADEDRRRTEVERLERELRDPALALLRESLTSPTTFPGYVEGLIALYEERFADALQEADALSVAVPWFYEAQLLAGEANLGWARAVAVGARDLDRERALMLDAAEAFATAADCARSLPLVRSKLCDVRARLIENSVIAQDDRLGDADIDAAFAVCQEALDLDPGTAQALVLQSGLSVLRARLGAVSDVDPAPAFATAIELADRAIAVDPDLPVAHTMAGWVRFWLAAQSFLGTGEDPVPELEQVIERFEAVKRLTPGDPGTDIYLGDAFWVAAASAHATGGDPAPWLDRGLELLETARAADPGNPSLAVPMANLLIVRGQCELARGGDAVAALRKSAALCRQMVESSAHPDDFLQLARAERLLGCALQAAGDDPGAAFQAAFDAATRAGELSPDYPTSPIGLGWVRYLMAMHEALATGQPGADADRAIADFERGLARGPGEYEGHLGLGLTHMLAARHLLDRGDDPQAHLAAARKAILQAVELRPSFGELRCALGSLELLEGRRRTRAGQSPVAAWEAAGQALALAVETGFDDAETLRVLAEVNLWRARWLRDRGAPTDDAVQAGLEASQAALEINPRLAEAELVRGELELERSMGLEDGKDSAVARGQALAAFERAVEFNGLLARRVPQKTE